MHHLELRHLRMIRAIAESGNMTRAAERLCVTQSALSQQLKDIEAKLGTDLFLRTRRKMIVTEIGRQLQDTAGTVLETVEKAERKINQRVNGERGELRVGTRCIFCYKWLPLVMQRFQKNFPNIELEIGNSHDLENDLTKHRFDLVISGATGDTEKLASSPLFQDQLLCIMRVDHPLAGCEFIRYEDFGDENFISHSDKTKNIFYQQVLKERGIKPKRLMNIGNPQAILELVAAGFGLAIFPRWAIGNADKHWPIVGRPIGARGFPLTWHAVFLAHNNTAIYQQEFIRCIGESQIADNQHLPKQSLPDQERKQQYG